MSIATHVKGRRIGRAFAAVAVLASALSLSIGGVAHADTSSTPELNVRAGFSAATVDATHGVTAGGTLAGATGGDFIKIHIDGPAGLFHGVTQTRLCRAEPGFDPSLDAQLLPSNGDCLQNSAPGMTGANPNSGSAIADASATFSDYTFSVGQGTETAHAGPGGPISCTVTSPCALWIQAVVDTSMNSDGYVLKHYDVTYVGNPDPPTLVSTPGNAKLTINLTPPANTGNAPITSYTVTVTGPGAGTPQTRTDTGPFVFTGLTNGTAYAVKATATNTGGNGAPHTSADSATTSNASTTPVPPPATNVTQTITAERPNGSLVLTQVCGVHGTTGLPGSAPTVGSSPGGAADPRFSGYPYPTDAAGLANPTYPTNCTVQMSTARLITSGAGAGHFFEATGDLNQITVVDTRDNDPGWDSTATMSTFVNQAAAADVLSADQLGWTPATPVTSGCATSADGTSYCQTVNAGAPVAPNTLGGPFGGTGALLAHGVASHGLGIARLDAALKLWLPIYAHNGTYVGTLTITAA